ncbi:DUF481 domain-containing protein [Corallincola luteus]|uniref:DUF481 domain-containing protein n=1 Tax=Corallincola luteus TaxID=1775177 RepID=A0ABY2AKC4_9GAMM|nr:DUF481 domain-containing protein [Corallincola luteus]
MEGRVRLVIIPFILSLFSLFSCSAFADLWSPLDDEVSDEDLARRGFAGFVEAGFNNSTGNTETTSYRSRIEVDHFLIGWRNRYAFESDFKKDDESTSQERYKVTLKAEKEWNETSSYTFVLGDYENDRFNGMRNLITISAGYGWRAWQADIAFLDLELGPGFRSNEAGDKDKEAIARGAARFEWQVSDTATLTEVFSTEIGQENRITRSETALSAELIGQLSLRLSFFMVYQSKPVDDDGFEDETLEEVDTRTSLTLLYSF